MTFRLPEWVTYPQVIRRSKKTLHVVMRLQLRFVKVGASGRRLGTRRVGAREVRKRHGRLSGIHVRPSKLLAGSGSSGEIKKASIGHTQATLRSSPARLALPGLLTGKGSG